jgi:Uma2 family endonuclease
MSADPKARSRPRPSPLDRDGVYRLTPEQFLRAAESGAFGDDRVELLGGLVFRKMTKNTPHNFTSATLHELILRAIPPGYFADKESSMVIPPHWRPEPDVMVVRGARRDYLPGGIGPGAVALLVEVSDESSLRRDRGRKLRGYARAGVAAYWIVDLVARQVEALSEPTGPSDRPAYRRRTIYRPDDELPLVIDGREVARFPVRELLP